MKCFQRKYMRSKLNFIFSFKIIHSFIITFLNVNKSAFHSLFNIWSIYIYIFKDFSKKNQTILSQF